MDPHKPITDSTDLLRGICEVQRSSDSAALVALLREAAPADEKGNECHCGPKSRPHRSERRPGLPTARLPKFDAQRAKR